ncbi:MAG TPA: ABC transporter ATP-binding protein [Methanoculleus sp.]|nr:ABC transporter ATP-binding protein [Methanoculleus sp.]
MVNLTVEDLCFSYGTRRVLDGISFASEPGTVTGIVGSNGCGKTTLLRCIDRLLVPSSGRVCIGDRDMASLSRREIAKAIAYVPQTAATRSALTVYEILLLGRRPYLNWSVTAADEEEVARAMACFGVGEFAFRHLHELSGGERQRVMIARAIAQDTGIILLDEPTSNLDLHHQMGVLEVLASVANEDNISILMAIHDLNLAARYCDEIIVLKDGTAFGTGSPAALFTPEMVREIYGIHAVVKHDLGAPYVVPLRVVGPDDGGETPAGP